MKKTPVYNGQGDPLGILGHVKIVYTSRLKTQIEHLSELDFAITHLSNYKKAQYIIADELDSSINPYGLTKTELQVLFYIIRDCTAKRVAHCLSIGIRAIETHIEHIKQKFNLPNKAAVINHAITHDYLKYHTQEHDCPRSKNS